jgi:hypothetical protein
LQALLVALLVAATVVGCGGDDDDAAGGDSFVADIGPAIEAVEAELGAGQQYFEVTANELVTNLFVAVDDATAAVPYVYLDGELQPPAPKLTGASGFTFSADAVDFDEETILDAVSDELPESTIEAFSIEGGDGGAVRYVVSTLSPEGGRLDVTVAPDGTILAVDPL